MFPLRAIIAASVATQLPVTSTVCESTESTAENLARSFWHELAPAISNGELYEVVLEETERNSVRYRGEDEAS